MDIQPYKITKATLEKDAPSWKWSAERHGFGSYSYVGKRDGEEVHVKAFAVMCGPAEDDYATQWRVFYDNKSEVYMTWLIRQCQHESVTTPNGYGAYCKYCGETLA